MFTEALQGLAERGKDLERLREQAGDFMEGGILNCRLCKTPKQAKIQVQDKVFTMPALCQCKNAEFEKQEAERKHRQLVDELRRNGITDRNYEKFTFASDDKKQPHISTMCMNYVTKWESMKATNTGLLLHGVVRSGKTFYAASIANALLEQGHSVGITNLPKLINQIQDSFEGRQSRVEQYTRFELLVIDDLGAVRSNDYVNETVFNIVDSRTRTGRPLIVTTNLAMRELENPTGIWEQRIYSRVLEMCPIDIHFTESRRTENRETARRQAIDLLGS